MKWVFSNSPYRRPHLAPEGAGGGGQAGGATGNTTNPSAGALNTSEGEGVNTGATGAGATSSGGTTAGTGATQAQQTTEVTQPSAKFTDADMAAARKAWQAEADQKAQEAQRQAEQKTLAEQGQYKTIAEQREQEINTLKAQLAERDQQALRSKVAHKHNLPDEVAERLKGATEGDLEADAAKLAALLKPATAPKTEGGAGNRPGGGSPAGAGNGAGGQGNGGQNNAGNQQQAKRYVFQQPGDVSWG